MKNIDILITGSGGSGQSYFMKQLGKNFVTNSVGDNDGLKHMSSPNHPKLSNYNVKKCIFLYNKSFECICSFYRRNPSWAWLQVVKLGNIGKLKASNLSSADNFFSLVEERNSDLFSIEYQFENWTSTTTPFPVYYVDFNNIDTSKLASFLNCEENILSFDVKPRRQYPELQNKFPSAYLLYQNLDKKKQILAQTANDRQGL
tara:strand:- start:619 stop:1224 length:606 start_codon:yes stop_codon:yes gene_type:complete